MSKREVAPRVGFEPTASRLTAVALKNLSAASGVAYRNFGVILTPLVAPNPAPKPGMPQPLGKQSTCFASPRRRRAAANIKRLPKRNASAVAKGGAYSVLAGRPSKQAVTAVFGKSGYALSWVVRADRLRTTPEELCERFKTDSNRVKKQWAELTQGKEKATGAD